MDNQHNEFTDAVVKAMKDLYPLEDADTAWDNVGLLLGNLKEASPARNRVLLTTDLTTSVADEAIRNNVAMVVAYHPIIFRGLKAITAADPQQMSLLRLVQKNIAVYCPHTSLDAAVGGINDWLLDLAADTAAELGGTLHSKTTVKPVRGPDSAVGYGRLAVFASPVDAYGLVRGVAKRLDGQRHVLIAAPSDYRHGKQQQARISSVAVCAGSGADVLRKTSADLLLTGEMSHHDALAAVHQNKWVVCVLHSNSERLFLRQRLQGTLQARLDADLGTGSQVLVSKSDCDPFVFWDVDEQPPTPGVA